MLIDVVCLSPKKCFTAALGLLGELLPVVNVLKMQHQDSELRACLQRHLFAIDNVSKVTGEGVSKVTGEGVSKVTGEGVSNATSVGVQVGSGVGVDELADSAASFSPTSSTLHYQQAASPPEKQPDDPSSMLAIITTDSHINVSSAKFQESYPHSILSPNRPQITGPFCASGNVLADTVRVLLYLCSQFARCLVHPRYCPSYCP